MTVQEAIIYRHMLSEPPFSKMQGGKFAYAAEKNRSKIQTALIESQRNSSIDEARAVEYDEKRHALQIQHCTKDEAGEPVLERGHYIGLDGNEEFQTAYKTLVEEYKDVNDAHAAWQKSELKVDIHKIRPDDLPDAIDADGVEMIKFMIWED